MAGMAHAQQPARLWLLLAAVCAMTAPLAARAYTLPPAGSPITVGPTTWNHSQTQHYSTPLQNPNPAVPASWSLVFDPVPKWSVIAIQNSMIPGTQDEFLFVYKSNPARLGYRDHAAAVFDLSKASLAGTLGTKGAPMGVQRNISVESNPWCGHMTQTHDGKILVVGGSDATVNDHTNGLKDIRLWDYRGPSPYTMPTTSQCTDGRWYPSLTLMQDTSIMIQGGTVLVGEKVPPSYILERWAPSTPTKHPLTKYPADRDFVNAVNQNYFPLQALLPTGELFVMNNHQIRIIKFDGSYRTLNNIPPFPDAKMCNEWPRSGSMVMGAYTAADNFTSVDIFVMGGAPCYNRCWYELPDRAFLAGRNVYRLRIKMSFSRPDGTGTPTYAFPDGKWTVEDMGIPRTGADPVVAPSGDIFLLGGSQRGCHGGQGKNFAPDGSGRYTIEPRNSAPAFWPILYQPDKPLGKRVTVLAGSNIARVYHHSAALTMDGHIMVAGCDECNASIYFRQGVDANATKFWSPLPEQQGKREHRIELMKTPFSLDENNRPAFVSIKVGTGAVNKDNYGNVTAQYNQVLTIVWKAAKSGVPLPEVTGVSLVAPTSATHSYNNNQRVVKLAILSKRRTTTTGTLTVQMPYSARVAPRQFYQLFLLNNKTNSRARWVRLR